jgi:hypothetical protein
MALTCTLYFPYKEDVGGSIPSAPTSISRSEAPLWTGSGGGLRKSERQESGRTFQESFSASTSPRLNRYAPVDPGILPAGFNRPRSTQRFTVDRSTPRSAHTCDVPMRSPGFSMARILPHQLLRDASDACNNWCITNHTTQAGGTVNHE